MVGKKNGEWRPCDDYQCLNQITVSDRYPIPLISHAQTSLTGCKVFRVIDLKSRYNQIPMDPTAVAKTAVISPFGPSFTGVGDAQQVYALSTNLPANETGINLAALQAAQMTDVDATQLSKLKGFSFSYVMF